MDNVTMSIGNLVTGETGFGFSNPEDLAKFGVAASSVSMDQFKQLHSTYNSLEIQVKELQAKGDDSCNYLSGTTFLNVGEFVA